MFYVFASGADDRGVGKGDKFITMGLSWHTVKIDRPHPTKRLKLVPQLTKRLKLASRFSLSYKLMGIVLPARLNWFAFGNHRNTIRHVVFHVWPS